LNGAETGIDCGGLCTPCLVQEPSEQDPYAQTIYSDDSGQGYVASNTDSISDSTPASVSSSTSTTLMQSPSSAEPFPAYLSYLIIFGVLFVVAMGALTFVNTLHILNIKSQQVARLEKPVLKPSKIESSVSSSQSLSEPESVSPVKKVSIEELKVLKSFVEKCRASDISTSDIRKALLDKGWDPSLVEIALE
jgi:hypothetical protein